MFKTNTVKHDYTVIVTSGADSFQTLVRAENMLEALRIASEHIQHRDRTRLELHEIPETTGSFGSSVGAIHESPDSPVGRADPGAPLSSLCIPKPGSEGGAPDR